MAALGQLLVVLDVTIVNVALPSMGEALNIAEADRQWVITAYTLPFAGLLLAGGRVADYLGRKRAFLIALLGFAVGSAVGGASVNLGMLTAARATQGASAALLAPTALALVATTFVDPHERGRAFAVFGAVMGGGSGVGLVLGGVVTEYLSWRWAMYITIPLALLAALGALFVLTKSERQRTQVDVAGALLATLGLAALVYGFSVSTTDGWTAPQTLGALFASVVLLMAFVIAETRVSNPLLPLGIVIHRSRGGAFLAFTLSGAGMFGMFLLVSFYLQTIAGFSALQTGVAFLPFAGGVVLANTLVGRVMTRVGSGRLLATGMLLAAAGMGWLTQLGVDSDYLIHVLPALLLIGLGLGTLAPVAANLSNFEVPESESGIASAVFNASEEVGASLGVAVLNTIAATSTAAYLSAHRPGGAIQIVGAVHGYTVATAWAAGILTVGAIVVLLLVNARLDLARPAN